jgi:hypothetical protein
MKKRILALTIILTVFINLLNPLIVFAETLQYHEVDGYRIKNNLNGSKTIQLNSDLVISGPNPKVMDTEMSEMAVNEEAAITEETPIDVIDEEVHTEIRSTYTQNQTLVTVEQGGISISFAPIMIEGEVLLEETLIDPDLPIELETEQEIVSESNEELSPESSTEPSPTPPVDPDVEPSPTPSAEPDAEPLPTSSAEPDAESSPMPSAEPDAEPSPTPLYKPSIEPSPTPESRKEPESAHEHQETTPPTAPTSFKARRIGVW